MRRGGGPEHHDLTGNTTRHAERHFQRLVLIILRGLREERISEGRLGPLEFGRHDDEPDAIPEKGIYRMHLTGMAMTAPPRHRRRPPGDQRSGKGSTGLVLLTDLVEQEREDEIGCKNKLGVWCAERRDRATVGMAQGPSLSAFAG